MDVKKDKLIQYERLLRRFGIKYREETGNIQGFERKYLVLEK